VWRTQRRYNSATGGSYAWLVRSSASINILYIYCVDADFGPFFLKFSTYLRYTAKLCINGNEGAKRQATKAGIGFAPLDDGFCSCDDVPTLQEICTASDRRTSRRCCKWLRILPNPFTDEDQTARSARGLASSFLNALGADEATGGFLGQPQFPHDGLDAFTVTFNAWTTW
jgi:hypothetical protein